jgi:hypothetical protein
LLINSLLLPASLSSLENGEGDEAESSKVVKSWLGLSGDQLPFRNPARITSVEQKMYLSSRKFQGI